MVCALDSGASGPGSSSGRGHCVVFLGKTLNSHGTLRWTSIPLSFPRRSRSGWNTKLTEDD